MKIALGQLQLFWEDKQANLKKVEECIKILQKEKADLFLLPEMSLTGFSMHTEKTKESHKETVQQIQRLAFQSHITIGVGWVKDRGNLCENHYSLIAPDRELLDYVKLHPFRYGGEAERFQGGNELLDCMCCGFRTGIQICYDLRFPEPFQILSRYTDIIFVPANWPAKRREHWLCLLKARAIENQVYLAGINCAGYMDNCYYSGDSGLYAPDGQLLCGEEIYLPGGCLEERLFVYEIKNNVSCYRKKFPIKEDRKENLYGTIFTERS